MPQRHRHSLLPKIAATGIITFADIATATAPAPTVAVSNSNQLKAMLCQRVMKAPSKK